MIYFRRAVAPKSIGILISAFEDPIRLKSCLISLTRQSRLPDTVYVTEDGQSDSIRLLLEELEVPFALVHRTIPHCGFRLAASRNNGIVAATEEYLVLIDCDLILHRDFVADHLEAAEPGFVVLGGRIGVDGFYQKSVAFQPSLFQYLALCTKGLIVAPFFTSYNGEPIRYLSKRFLRGLLNGNSFRGPFGVLIMDPNARSLCGNFGIWRSDILNVNGFDEEFTGYGFEDHDLLDRLARLDLKFRKLKFRGIAWHINHPQNSSLQNFEKNRNYQLRPEKAIFCENGINKRLL